MNKLIGNFVYFIKGSSGSKSKSSQQNNNTLKTQNSTQTINDNDFDCNIALPLCDALPNQAFEGLPLLNPFQTVDISQQPQSAVTSQTSIQEVECMKKPNVQYFLHKDVVIGRGSYGSVCLATQQHPSSKAKQKRFASKCVAMKSDPKYIAKLEEEVKVLREVYGHPFIIKIYDVLCLPNEILIITELGRGGDLFHLLTTHPKHGVTESYAAKSVTQMLSAVLHLHKSNICHRDLKLENWVLSMPNAWSDLKLIDFGLSTHFTPGVPMTRVVGSR